jgi:ABC-2 type transport system ATP-binding protein
MLVVRRLTYFVASLAIVSLVGCGGRGSTGTSGAIPQADAPSAGTAALRSQAGAPMPAPTAPPDAPGHINAVPTPPAKGQSRTGLVYDVYVQASTGDTVAFTVFEPGTLAHGKTYPLILQSHGWGGSRVTSLSTAESLGDVGNIPQFVANGYGVISIDERGWGETTGKIRSMDPDYEGQDDLAVMNWAQAKLGWIAYGPTVDGTDPHEPIVGSVGGSYGGMYQLMLLDIDARKRLHAIVPQFTPYALNYSLFPNGVSKNLWSEILFGTGETNAEDTSLTASRADEDQAILTAQLDGFTTGTETSGDHDFYEYHSNRYWCTNETVETNGAGLMPLLASKPPPKINAMFYQGMRDTLFDFNEAYENYSCLKKAGGDVRLLTYQYGHNSAGIVPDPGETLYQPPNNDMNTACGQLTVDTATLAFFNEHLKMQKNAAAAVPTTPCISLSAGDGVVVPSVTTGSAGTAVTIPATTLVAGAGEDIPIPIDLGLVAPASGNVIGGIPQLSVTIAPVGVGLPVGPIPVIFAGIGQMRAAHPGVWDLVDNEVTPIRGVGMQTLDMTGISQRLAPGDRLALLLYGNHDQYTTTGNVLQLAPAVLPVTVSGTVWVPLLGPLQDTI